MPSNSTCSIVALASSNILITPDPPLVGPPASYDTLLFFIVTFCAVIFKLPFTSLHSIVVFSVFMVVMDVIDEPRGVKPLGHSDILTPVLLGPGQPHFSRLSHRYLPPFEQFSEVALSPKSTYFPPDAIESSLILAPTILPSSVSNEMYELEALEITSINVPIVAITPITNIGLRNRLIVCLILLL